MHVHNPFIFVSGDRHMTEILKVLKKDVGLNTGTDFFRNPRHDLH